jgi:osmotically-inducible protein OsmY
MKLITSTKVASAALAVVCSFSPLLGSAQTGQKPAPDNSKVNADHGTTADNQSNTSSDRLMTANVRKAIMADKDLSTYAHNIKIVTTNGHVTLKGPVKSEDEKQRIVSDLSGVVPADSLTNQLTVKP